MPVQIEYRQFAYKCEISYVNDSLVIEFAGNEGFPDGMTFVCDETTCEITYMDITREYNHQALPEDFLPVVLYDFMKDFSDTIVAEGRDDSKKCDYIKRSVNSSFVTLEIYNEGKSPAYGFVIT